MIKILLKIKKLPLEQRKIIAYGTTFILIFVVTIFVAVARVKSFIALFKDYKESKIALPVDSGSGSTNLSQTSLEGIYDSSLIRDLMNNTNTAGSNQANTDAPQPSDISAQGQNTTYNQSNSVNSNLDNQEKDQSVSDLSTDDSSEKSAAGQVSDQP